MHNFLTRFIVHTNQLTLWILNTMHTVRFKKYVHVHKINV